MLFVEHTGVPDLCVIVIVLYHSEEVFFTSSYFALKDHGRQFNSFFEVPQRIEEQGDAAEDSSAGVPGLWGSWGPWSACSRSCSGGVMEQTRPCLPAYYRERGYRRPGRHFPPSERALPHHSAHFEDPLAAYPGHVISAIRTSVPLHRSEEQPWAGPRNSSQGGRAALRGSRHSQGPRHSAKPDRRYGPGTASLGNGSASELGLTGDTIDLELVKKTVKGCELKRSRSRNPIGPGKYGYGKVPYILPLQTDTGQQPQKLRRQRQSSRNHLFHQSPGLMSSYSQAAAPSLQHGSLYQEPAGPQAGHQGLGPSVYQSPSFPASQSLFHGGDSNPQALQGQPQPQRAAAIVCIGAYKQYKLCNTNMCPESSRNIREVQCASYNNKPFMGRFYEWEPFAEATDVQMDGNDVQQDCAVQAQCGAAQSQPGLLIRHGHVPPHSLSLGRGLVRMAERVGRGS
ncbi:hypothetical protein Nmel_013497 [Mimus melanotis]